MSISRRIQEQIEQMDVDAEMKKMMKQILRAESLSKSNYKNVYDKVIAKYLKAKSSEGGIQ